jgi:hypothetical protein
VSQGQNVTEVPIGSKCHSGRGKLERNVQAALMSLLNVARDAHISTYFLKDGTSMYSIDYDS